MRPTPKLVVMINQTSTTNAATSTGIVDTLGYDHLEIAIAMATANVVSNTPSVMQLLESDDTVLTNAATFSGLVSGTDYTLATAAETAASNTPNAYLFGVNLLGRKRYIRLQISPRTTQVHTAIARLSKGDEAPINSTKAGVKLLAVG